MKSSKSYKARLQKIYVDLGKMKNEDLRGLIKHLNRRIKYAKRHKKHTEAPRRTIGGPRRPIVDNLKRMAHARGLGASA